MIKCIKGGDILQSDCQAIINTVNTKGVMGKGLALLYRKKYPDMFTVYRRACLDNKVKTGSMHLWKVSNQDKWVVNFPTKDHWRQPSQMEWIISGLQNLVEVVKEKGFTSIAIPPLGCGLGGLHWYLVKKEILKVCEESFTDLRVEIYEPE
jgi:O-acetyl-ADP-ribose deacetylase (regulator of RNase III)